MLGEDEAFAPKVSYSHTDTLRKTKNWWNLLQGPCFVRI